MKTDSQNDASHATGIMTIEEFASLEHEGWHLELVRGHLVREPWSGYGHSRLGARMIALIQRFLDEHDLGELTGADGAFVLFDEPPTVRVPDVAFIARDRLDFDPDKFAPHAPDLAVEIVSPSNTISGMYEKVMDYLEAGTRLVWVVEPRSRSVTVYRSPEEIHLLTGDSALDGEDVLPGFRISLRELFDR